MLNLNLFLKLYPNMGYRDLKEKTLRAQIDLSDRSRKDFSFHPFKAPASFIWIVDKRLAYTSGYFRVISRSFQVLLPVKGLMLISVQTIWYRFFFTCVLSAANWLIDTTCLGPRGTEITLEIMFILRRQGTRYVQMDLPSALVIVWSIWTIHL